MEYKVSRIGKSVDILNFKKRPTIILHEPDGTTTIMNKNSFEYGSGYYYPSNESGGIYKNFIGLARDLDEWYEYTIHFDENYNPTSLSKVWHYWGD